MYQKLRSSYQSAIPWFPLRTETAWKHAHPSQRCNSTYLYSMAASAGMQDEANPVFWLVATRAGKMSLSFNHLTELTSRSSQQPSIGRTLCQRNVFWESSWISEQRCRSLKKGNTVRKDIIPQFPQFNCIAKEQSLHAIGTWNREVIRDLVSWDLWYFKDNSFSER